MENWVFWLLIAVIVLLISVIFIRDKGIRGKFLGIFVFIKNKIRIARLKGRINKETESLDELLSRLGEEAWHQGVDSPGITEQVGRLTSLDQEKAKLEQEVESLNKEIEAEKGTWEAFEKKQDELVKEQENNVEPLKKEMGSLKKEQGELEKGITEQSKIKAKLEKKISQQEKKKEEIKQDEDLSSIEREEKTKEVDAEISELKVQVGQANDLENSLKEKAPGLISKIAALEPRVIEFEKKITELKEELVTREKAMNEKVAEARKNRNILVGDIALKKKEMGELFVFIGGDIEKNRVDNSLLLPIYAQIDGQKKSIEELESQLGRDNKVSPPN